MHRAHHEVRLAHARRGRSRRVERVQRARARRELAQEEVLGREAPRRRKAAHGRLQPAVGMTQARPDDGRARVRVRERGEPSRPRRRAPRRPRSGSARTRPTSRAMPRFQPAPSPRFSCSTSRTSGKRSRTNVDRAVGRAVIDDDRLVARRRSPGSCSSHGSALYVTTTTDTSAATALARADVVALSSTHACVFPDYDCGRVVGRGAPPGAPREDARSSPSRG